MNLKQQIHYFIYVTAHWGWRVGFFTLRTEWKGEKKYQINTTSVKDLSKLQIKGVNLLHATEYMPVNYQLLETLLSHLPQSALTGTFIDIGCGKGRALCVAAVHGFAKVQGIDFAKELLDEAEKNIISLKKRYPQANAELFWMDLADYKIPPTATCLFLFNPFNEHLTLVLLKKIKEWQLQQSRPLYVLYASPRFSSHFLDIGFQKIYHYRAGKYVEGMLLVLNR